MRLLFSITVIVLVTVSVNSQQQNQKPRKAQQPSPTEQRGTQESPIVIKVLPTPKTPEEAAQEAKGREDKAANDGNLVKLTGVLALVGFLQLLVFGYQAYKLRETVKSAGEQSEAMERHIGEAARSAKAMEDIVSVINFGNHAVMRAYLTVIIGQAIFQEKRGEGQSDLNFQVKPLVVNAGNTPARKVCIRTAAAILPIPPPEDFKFPLPDVGTTDAGVIGAHQNYTLTAIVEAFVPWEEVADIKTGVKNALCAWGTVTYEDMFGGTHTTRFGQIITWLTDGKTVWGYYIPGQNDAD